MLCVTLSSLCALQSAHYPWSFHSHITPKQICACIKTTTDRSSFLSIQRCADVTTQPESETSTLYRFLAIFLHNVQFTKNRNIFSRIKGSFPVIQSGSYIFGQWQMFYLDFFSKNIFKLQLNSCLFFFKVPKVIGQLTQTVLWTVVAYSFVIFSSIKQVKGVKFISGVAFAYGSACCEPAVKGAERSETSHL